MNIRFENIRNTMRKICRYGIYIPLSNVVLNYLGNYLSDDKKEDISNRRNGKIQRHLWPILNRVIVTNRKSGSEPISKYNPKIWVCWLQGENNIPPVSQLCLSSIRKNANGHEVILITNDNYKEYVNLPIAIINRYNNGQFKPAHFADVIRINLLAQRGGVWLDSTLLVTQPIDDTIFDYDFYSIRTKEEGYFVSHCRWAVFMLACHPGNKILTQVSKAFTEYLTSTDLFIDYFLFDHFIDMLYQSDPDVRNQIDAIPLNNPNVHKLNSLLPTKYNEEQLLQLTKNTAMFKLSNSTYYKVEQSKESPTYFDEIKRKYK